MNPFQNGLAPTLVRWAARYPAATEDFPWGERVAKVNQEVIAFLGRDGAINPSVTLKLPFSAPFALSEDCSEPPGWLVVLAALEGGHLTREEAAFRFQVPQATREAALIADRDGSSPYVLATALGGDG